MNAENCIPLAVTSQITSKKLVQGKMLEVTYCLRGNHTFKNSYSINPLNKEIAHNSLLTVNQKIQLFFTYSCRVVGPACIHSCIGLADFTKSEVSCFRSRTLHPSAMYPRHIWVWFASRFTTDINRTLLAVTCIYLKTMSNRGWLCKIKKNVETSRVIC